MDHAGLGQGGRFLGHTAGGSIAVDLLMTALFAWYLLATRPAGG